VLDAVQMALWRRDRDGHPDGPGLVHHSDAGSPGTPRGHSPTGPARPGCCPRWARSAIALDNAMIESFWGRVQTELLNRQRWRTRIELANALFEYLEIFHNRRRRHSSLGMLTPIEYELRADTTEPVA
jgi:putative transposase